MGLFTRYAMDALMKTSHPEVIRRQCWNLHPHRTPCTACKDICPYGDAIFTRPNLVKDWDPCTDCGLCVSACRSGCIVPSPEQVQRDTSLADTDNDTLWLGCQADAQAQCQRSAYGICVPVQRQRRSKPHHHAFRQVMQGDCQHHAPAMPGAARQQLPGGILQPQKSHSA